MSLTTHHIISHSTGISNPRTCTGAELFQIWIHPRDFLCMFISNGLTSPKWSPAWPTPRLKLSHLVTIFSIWLKMGLCADTGYVQSVSFSIIYLTSILLKSGVIFFVVTLISDGVLSWVSWLNLFMGLRLSLWSANQEASQPQKRSAIGWTSQWWQPYMLAHMIVYLSTKHEQPFGSCPEMFYFQGICF